MEMVEFSVSQTHLAARRPRKRVRAAKNERKNTVLRAKIVFHAFSTHFLYCKRFFDV